MSYHNDITGARASEVTREAGLEVSWLHARQREVLGHVGLTQQGVQDHLERAHDAADGSADDHHQFVLREANAGLTTSPRLFLQEGQGARGYHREETIVPGGR